MTVCAFAILALVVLKIRDLRQLLFSVPNPISVQTSSGRQVALGTTPRPDSSVVERGPEKAGVGGSIPSLATTFQKTYGNQPASARPTHDHIISPEPLATPLR